MDANLTRESLWPSIHPPLLRSIPSIIQNYWNGHLFFSFIVFLVWLYSNEHDECDSWHLQSTFALTDTQFGLLSLLQLCYRCFFATMWCPSWSLSAEKFYCVPWCSVWWWPLHSVRQLHLNTLLFVVSLLARLGPLLLERRCVVLSVPQHPNGLSQQPHCLHGFFRRLSGQWSFSLHACLNWQQAVFYDACLGVVLWLIMFFVLKDTPQHKHFKPEAQSQSLKATLHAFKKAGSNLKIGNVVCTQVSWISIFLSWQLPGVKWRSHNFMV